MSLWSRDEHRIVLQKNQVLLVTGRRELTVHGVRRHVQAKQVLSCSSVDGNAGTGEKQWDGALATLESALPALAKRNSHATVILSNHFMRYALIPRSEALSDEKEELSFARHSFREMYGSAADSWELRINHEQTGTAAQVACAVDTRLLTALRESFGRMGIKLQSVQPHLMLAYNSCQRLLNGRSAWLVLVERDNLCLALLRDGEWAWVRTIRTGVRWREGLPFFLERETYLTNTDPTTSDVFIWAPDHQDEAMPCSCRWQFKYLQPQPVSGLVPEQDRRFAMYMN